MDQQAFDHLIAEALDTLPEEFGRLLDNVHVESRLWPTPDDLRDGNVPQGGTLFGLYRGVPRTSRGNYHGVLPDRILLFMGPMVMVTRGDSERMKQQIRVTLLHEIGHHFGMSEEAIRHAQSQ